MKEQWQRMLKAADLITEVQTLVWWYYRPHLISIRIDKDYEGDDEGGVIIFYHQGTTVTVESKGDELWLDAEYIPTRREPSLECVLLFYGYTEKDIEDADFSEHVPPAIEEKDFDGYSITLTNPFPTLEQIEALVCEF